MYQHQSDNEEAQQHLENSLRLHQKLDKMVGIANSLDAFATLIRDKDNQCAACLWGAAAALRKAHRVNLSQIAEKKMEAAVSSVKKSLGEDAFNIAWEHGQELTAHQATAIALQEDECSVPLRK